MKREEEECYSDTEILSIQGACGTLELTRTLTTTSQVGGGGGGGGGGLWYARAHSNLDYNLPSRRRRRRRRRRRPAVR
jgi:hypothetical protein